MRASLALALLIAFPACHRSHRTYTTYETDARKTVEAWAQEVTRGGSGAHFWLRPAEADKLFAVRSCQVLSVHGVDENGVDVVARVESSNRAGLPITADWTFFLSRTGDEWKIEFLAAR